MQAMMTRLAFELIGPTVLKIFENRGAVNSWFKQVPGEYSH